MKEGSKNTLVFLSMFEEHRNNRILSLIQKNKVPFCCSSLMSQIHKYNFTPVRFCGIPFLFIIRQLSCLL